MKELDLTYLKELIELPGMDALSSDLTESQRTPLPNLGCRIRNCLNHRGLPGRWILLHGWPKTLDLIKEYAKTNNIKLTGL